jgi:hypothetical protein
MPFSFLSPERWFNEYKDPNDAPDTSEGPAIHHPNFHILELPRNSLISLPFSRIILKFPGRRLQVGFMSLFLILLQPFTAIVLVAIVGALPATAPPGGLGSNVNYFFYSSGQTIRSLQVTIKIETQLIVGDTFAGVGFQLNGFSPNNTVTYQQLGWQFNEQQVGCFVNTWLDDGHGNVTSVVDQINYLDSNNLNGSFAAGTVFSVTVLFDSSNNVNGGLFGATVGGTNYTSTMLFNTVNTDIPPELLAPITAFTLDIVAADGGRTAQLKQGSGTITYQSSTNSFVAVNKYPNQLSPEGTGEVGNTEYGSVDSAPAQFITQSWGVKN